MESVFFDSQVTYDEYGTPVYDRPNSAEHLRSTFSSLITNGVVSTRHNNMSGEVGFIVQPSNGMTVTTNAGLCWINGACGIEKEKREFTLDIGTEQPRIDAIVLRWDNRQAARNIDIFVKKGTPSGDPIIPTLQRDYSVYELRLANIYIPANSSTISGGNIADTRFNTEECGVVKGLVESIDTTQIYNQIQSDLKEFKQNEKHNFLEWFETIQDILDENAAANLQKQVDEKVPMVRTINGKSLEKDITITVDDIGIAALFLAIHPVGDIYMTTNPTDPGMRFGGTWVAWGAGRVPVGVNTSDTDFRTVEKTGGEKAHILTEAEVPPHRHRQVNYWSGDAGSSTVVTQGLETSDPRVYGGYDVFTESAGGGQAHNNLQPYITCYMWKRVA